MTEQKNPLNTQPAAAPQPERPGEADVGRERWRRWKAELQCHLVRLKHKATKKTRAHRNNSLRRLRAWPVYHQIGQALYLLGFEGEYAAVCAGRSLRRGAARLARLVRAAAGRVGRLLGAFGRMLWEDVLQPVVVFFRGIFHMLRYAHQVRREKGLPRAVWEALCYLGRGIRLYARLLPHAIAYVVPVLVAAGCLMYVRSALDVHYTLAVQIENEKSGQTATVGYVASEGVFESAKADVNERLNYAGTSHTSWDIQPTYTLTALKNTRGVLNENQMADAILEASGDEIAEGTALYIDGELCRVTTEGDDLSGYLEEMKAPYEAEAGEDTTVQFNHTVELVEGVFFTDSFSDYSDVVEYLNGDQIKQQTYTIIAGDTLSGIAAKNGLTQAELYALNTDIGLNPDSAIFPGDTLIVQRQEKVLEVQTVQTLTYEEPIPYSTNRTKSSEYSFGVTKTIQQGQDGISLVTAQVTRDAAGNEISTVILSRETIQEPVTKEVVVGTRLSSGMIAQIGSGTLMWPVPGYTYCSRWASSGHKGVDICGAYGTPIYASDGGVVTKSGYNAAGSGYGYSIVIDHGNGYQTLYAHCSALYVSVGQSVSQGQQIAAMGSTGRSTGNHCHFEIRKNGTIIWPQTLFSK